jgi:GTP cyclohydrolase II
MSKVTVRQAAALTGKSRETINTACNDGVLSCSANERGIKVVDVSELERVYPLVKSMDQITRSEPVKSSQVLTEEGSSDLKEQLAVLKARLESAATERDMLQSERERERRQLVEEIENLRETLSKAQDQHGKAMLLLTDQSGKGEASKDEQLRELAKNVELVRRQNKRLYQEIQKSKNQGFWERLFGKKAVSAQ